MNKLFTSFPAPYSCDRKKSQKWHMRNLLAGWVGLAVLLLVLSGCKHRKVSPLPAQEAAPPETQSQAYPPTRRTPPARIAPTPAPPGGVSDDDLEYIQKHKPILTEEGMASWYTAPYKGRRSANGQVFSDDSLTAAHRTLPMGSLITVTNLKTGQSSAMRVTDRGPFVEDRFLDLTVASAKATGVYWPGSAPVRMEVYRTPKPVKTGGRWCVQIGAFTSESKAKKLKAKLLDKYPDANVIEFPGEKSYWVRIRPQGDDRAQAESIAHKLHPAEGEAYLTRLD